MIDSNWTLRFNRTARQAFGQSLEFHDSGRKTELLILGVAVFVVGFLLGYWIG